MAEPRSRLLGGAFPGIDGAKRRTSCACVVGGTMRHSGRSAGRALIVSGALWLLASLLGGGEPTWATTVRPLNLEQLTARAGHIVVGRCISVRDLPQTAHGMPVREVTIRVDRALKGGSGPTLTFRMVAPDDSDADLRGVPRFRPGEDLLLFLYPTGRSGLTSPVGLGQGKFVRRMGKHGGEESVNAFGNSSVLPGERGREGHRTADLVRAIEELVR